MLLNRESSGERWRKRRDGKEKVTGELRYLTDMTAEGMLYGRVLRSIHPHARILSLDVSEAEAYEGVIAVITHQDVPGLNRFGIATPDQPALCEDTVRYIGDAIAAVAATSLEIAEHALSLIHVEYEVLETITDPTRALEESAPRLHPQGNVLHRTQVKRGSTDTALADCAYVVHQVYSTPRQMHAYMETEGGLFVPESDGRLTVYAPTQHGYKDRMQIARILGWDEERIRVISSPIGGSFGGKDELNVQPYGSLLALKSGRPIKMHNSRQESVRAGLKRHPMKIEMKTGMDEQGRLIAHYVRIVADTGAYATLGAPVLNFATEHSMGPYRMEHVDVEGVSVYTNNGLSGEFRGFGGNQAIFAMEGQMDRLAEMIHMDPWEFRMMNRRLQHDPGPLEQRILQTNGLEQVMQALAESKLWQRKLQLASSADSEWHDNVEVMSGLSEESSTFQPPWIKRGIGAALAMHGAGLGYGIDDPAGGRLALNEQGKIEVSFSYEEFGQGLIATLEMMLMDLFQCEPDDLSIVIGDTDRVPHSGSSTASRSTTMAWMALQRLKTPFLQTILKIATQITGVPSEQLTTGVKGIRLLTDDPILLEESEPVITYLEIAEYMSQAGQQEQLIFDTEFAYPTTPDAVVGGHYLYTYAAVAAEVEVNTLTGHVKLLANYHTVAAGPVINPMGFLGQIEGGSVMALGFTLTEDAVMDQGHYLTKNMDTYLIPTIKDMHTSLEVEAIEDLPEGDTFGPRGIGEIGSVALAPAITAAIRDAVGVWVPHLPVARELLIQPIETWQEEGVSPR
ncbi:putative xanthine dehydrogenase subunit D [Paenibacillus nuruki]|uniref:Putative xanthine dehydrogenase subunit D n=1 Tax=Paenibacillus nuruki TaxID=1886670 RepID=A0A1E3L4X9_9BACL|nr:xanthine dehydrogenase subunit D [Paenibacillus nuruki]ODP28734.1 putative xanthine dehydrogenase subunit D [Paenibacillus nuruki]